MSNLVIGYGNRITDATLSGGSWSTSLPLDNLKDRRLHKVARSTDDATSSTKFDVNLGASLPTRVVAVVNHNLSEVAEWRVRISGDPAFATSDYDSGWTACYALDFDYDLEWEDDNWWTGTMDDEYIRHPWMIAVDAGSSVWAQYLRIEFSDATNPDGYVQIGRCFAGPGWQPAVNAEVGLQDAWNDVGSATRGVAGAVFVAEARRYRSTLLTLPLLSLDPDAITLWEIQRRCGTTGEIVYLPNPASAEDCQRYGYLGRLREISPLEYPYIVHKRSALVLEELL